MNIVQTILVLAGIGLVFLFAQRFLGTLAGKAGV